MKQSELLNECVKYFKDNKGFKRMLEKMREKYISLGHFGGTVKLTSLTIEEKEAFTGFFKKNFMNQKSATIKVERIQKALEHTRFNTLNMEDVLKTYFSNEIISKKDQYQIYIKQRDDFFQNIFEEFKNTIAGDWIRHVINTKINAYRTFITRYDYDKKALKYDIQIVCKSLNNLPYLKGKKKRIALFASQITTNPHAFDDGTQCNQLLTYGLMYFLKMDRPQNAEDKAELFYKAGILFEELANYTICYGLKAYSSKCTHPGWQGFYDMKEPMQVSLNNLSHVEGVFCEAKTVFVFENPTVFSTILEQIKHPNLAMICTYGHVRLASLELMDLLIKEGTQIYYSGDMDPEGLLIANKLKSRYSEKLTLWRYNHEAYQIALSNHAIAEERLKKMEHIQDEGLKELAKHIQQKKLAGYQELLIGLLVEDIREILIGCLY